MIKVFTVGNDTKTAGDALTALINEWIKGYARGIEIIATHTTCNDFGWMVTITYKPK